MSFGLGKLDYLGLGQLDLNNSRDYLDINHSHNIKYVTPHDRLLGNRIAETILITGIFQNWLPW